MLLAFEESCSLTIPAVVYIIFIRATRKLKGAIMFLQRFALISAAVLAFSFTQVGVSRAASTIEFEVTPTTSNQVDIGVVVSPTASSVYVANPLDTVINKAVAPDFSPTPVTITSDTVNPAAGVSPCF